MYILVLTFASMTKYVHRPSQGMVVLCMYSVRTSMSEYVQGVRFPDVELECIYACNDYFPSKHFIVHWTGTFLVKVILS
jgi:hypothetical protein